MTDHGTSSKPGATSVVPALYRVRQAAGEPGWARGTVETGPEVLLPVGLDQILAEGTDWASLWTMPGETIEAGPHLLVPLQTQELWAAGVTFERSRAARMEESDSPDPYDKVYRAERPELFFKAGPGRVQGPGEPIGIRADSAWDVPEPELVVLADSGGRVVAYAVGNDVSSRTIEGENPLYLPQAKVYHHSAAVGPCWVPTGAVGAFDNLEVALVIERESKDIFRGSASLGTMRRRPDELISWLFRAQEFPTGVALLTGTSIVPPAELTLRPGDRVHISITGDDGRGLGALENVVEMVENRDGAALQGGRAAL
jgi:2-dehydro-3-deoxy-D-arabinonate dehydratase